MSKVDLFSQFSSVDEAMRWCKSMIRIMKPFISNNGACVVLDIDGTLLNSNMQAVPAVIQLAQFVQTMGLPIHVITARIDMNNSRQITMEQLAHAGMQLRGNVIAVPGRPRAVIFYESLSLRSLRDLNNNNFSGYKHRIRCNLPQPVLLNVGDQWDDLVRRGQYARTRREQMISQTVQTLPSKNIYVGQMSDCSWFSVKVPM